MNNRIVLPETNDLGVLKRSLQTQLDRLVSGLNREASTRTNAQGARLSGVGRPAEPNDAVTLGFLKGYIGKVVDGIEGRIEGLTPSISQARSLRGPDHVTNISANVEQFIVRAQVLNRITVKYDSPPPGEWWNDGFIGVRVTLIEGAGVEYPKGTFEFFGEPGDTDIEFVVEHNAPEATGVQGLRLVAANHLADADLDTAPVIEFQAFGKETHANPPNNVQVTVTDHPLNDTQFGLEVGWDPPSLPGGTIGYDVRVQYFADEAATTPLSEPIIVGKVDGVASNYWKGGYWPKPVIAEWVQAAVRGVGAFPLSAGAYSGWVTSPTALVGDRATVVTPPTGVVVEVIGYRTDAGGEQWAHIRVSGTAGTNVDIIRVYSARTALAAEQPALDLFSDTDPNNPGGTFYVTPGEPFSFQEFWAKRPAAGEAAQKLWVAVVGNSQALGVWLGPGTVIGSVTLEARSLAPQITSANVTIESPSPIVGGVPSNRFTFTFSPTADPEFWYCRVERIRCDSSYTPLGGASYEQNGYFGIDSSPHTQPEYWPLPPATEYWKWRFRAVNQAEEPNNASPIYVNMSVPGTSGLDLTAINPDKVTGFEVFEGKFKPKVSNDFSISVDGKLTQEAVNLAKATGFSNEFKIDSGTNQFVIDKIAVNKLLAGTALFTGDVIFQYDGTGGKVTINSTGVQIARGNSAWVDVSASGVAVVGPGGSVGVTNTAIQLVSGSNVVEVTSSGMTLTGGGQQVTLTSSGITIGTGSTAITVSGTGASMGPLAAGNTTVGTLTAANDAAFVQGFTHVGSTVSLNNPTNWRTALQLKGAATADIGTGSSDVAAGNHTHSFSAPDDLPTDGSANLGDCVNKINELLSALRSATI